MKAASRSASGPATRPTLAVGGRPTAVGGTAPVARTLPPARAAARGRPARVSRRRGWTSRVVGVATAGTVTSVVATERLRSASTEASVGGAVRHSRATSFTVVAGRATALTTGALPRRRPTSHRGVHRGVDLRAHGHHLAVGDDGDGVGVEALAQGAEAGRRLALAAQRGDGRRAGRAGEVARALREGLGDGGRLGAHHRLSTAVRARQVGHLLRGTGERQRDARPISTWW